MSVLGTSSLSAQIRGNNIVVTVTPDHQDWNYRIGEKANFTVNVRKSGTLLNQVKVDYEAGPAMFPEVKKSTTLKDGTMKWCGSLNRPGFYRLKVIAHVDGKDYEGLCTAGFSPEKIQPFAQEPKDFDAFWKKALDEARQNDLNPTKVLLPERCTKDKNVYEISYNNNRWGSKMYGILSVPVKKVSIRLCSVYLVRVYALMPAILIRLLLSASYWKSVFTVFLLPCSRRFMMILPMAN